MKKFVIALSIITALLLGYTMRSSENAIVICASTEQFRNEYLMQALKENFPDQNIVTMYMPTGKAAAKIAAEGTQTDVDILIGLETSYLEKLKPNLADVSSYSRLLYVEGLSPEDVGNRWCVWERFAGAIIVNQQVLTKCHLPVPQTYSDLLDPQYRGLIAMPDPKSSSTGYFFYKNWVNEWGEEAALSYADSLAKNIKQFTESGSGPIKLLIQGETAIGLGMTFQAVNEINEGVPLEIIYPSEGSPYSLTGAAMIEGRQRKKGVEDVFRFLVNECLVYDKENFSPETILQNQKNKISNYPQNIHYADMQGLENVEEKDRLLTAWKF